MTKKIDKSKTIIKDDGVRIIFKNDIVHSVIYTKCKPPPLTNYQRKKLYKREQKHIKLFCKSWFDSECDY
jgi:hypothetical protein